MYYKKTFIILCSIFLFIATLTPLAIVQAADGPLSVSVGINGLYKNGFWTPVTVQLDATDVGGILELSTPDSDGAQTVLRQACESACETLYLPFGKANGELILRLYKEEGQTPVWEKTLKPLAAKQKDKSDAGDFLFLRPVAAERPLYLIVGDPNIGLTEALGELRIKEERRPLVAEVSHFTDLPDQWLGYEAVTCVVLTTTVPDFFDGVTGDDPRLLALEKWVENGGRLFLSTSADAIPLLLEGGPLARFLPGRVDAERHPEVRIANNLTQYVPKAKNLVMTGSLDSPFLLPPFLTDIPDDARIEIAEMETPLLVRMPKGLGTVTFFAADLAKAPIANWSGRSGLVLRLFHFDTDRSRQATADSFLVQLGYSDLAGQLRSTLDRFPNVKNIPFSLVLLLAFVYILLIGPGDWYLTHKLLKKPNLTWLTFPVYVLCFCLLVVVLMTRAKPAELQLNTAELVDVDVASGLVRGTTWSGLYSPSDNRYDITLVPNVPGLALACEPEVLLSWHGLTGTGLGGMAPKTISPQDWTEAWQLGSPRSQLKKVPVRIHGTRSLLGRWLGRLDGAVPSALTSFDTVPTGTVTNPFNVPLSNAILYYDRWAVDLGELAPGETQIDLKSTRIERHLAIEGPLAPFADSSKTMTQHGKSRYDTESTAIPYILRMMMFYQLTGGYEQLGLDNTLGHFVDLSDLLRTGRAVLVGTIRDESPDRPAVDAPRGSRLELCDERAGTGKSNEGESASTLPDSHSRDTLIIRMILPVGKQQ
ncbi:MAG: hypothetical protein Q4G68_03775 [Planctomycetia bacterium]|nr:hypothetical protein [Planctomycetia bacterium]